MGLNLNRLAQGAISTIHPNEQITLYISLGQVNQFGLIKPIYQEPQVLNAQVQNYERQTIGKNFEFDAKIAKRVYLNAENILIPSSLVRQEERGGDIIELSDGSYWLATATLDDYRLSGWVCLKCEQQIKEPDFTASPWYTVNL